MGVGLNVAKGWNPEDRYGNRHDEKKRTQELEWKVRRQRREPRGN